MMKNGPGGGERTSRKEILDDYVRYYSHTWSEACAKVCNDARVITKAGEFLLSDTEPRERFQTFPFYQIFCEGSEAAAADHRSYLKGFIKAAEVLELLCVNLFLFPWKKEFKTLKTFTGTFVYSLLPVLSSSTIQSVLALIGYLPDTDTQQRTSSRYRLSEEANPDRAMAVGFELMLARLECQHILRLTEQAQQGSQEWAEILQGRAMHHGSHTEESLGQPSATTTTVGQENDEVKEEEETQEDSKVSRVCSVVDREDREENEEDDDDSGDKEPNQASQVPLSLEARPKVKAGLRQGVAAVSSSTRHLLEDKSIMEMQRNYPDLAIRGRPLLQNKTRTGSSSSNSIKAVSVDSTDKGNGSSRTANVTSSDHNNGVKADSVAVSSSIDGGKADDVTGNNVTTTSTSTTSSRSDSKASKMHSDINADSCKAGNQIARLGRNNSSRSNSNSVRGRGVCDTTSSGDKSRAGDVSSESDLSGPAAISLHITLRAGTTQTQTSEDKTPKFEDHRAEPLPRAVARRGDQPLGGLPKSVLSSKEQPSMGSIIEEELAERMDHMHLQKRKASRRRDGETKNEEKKRKGERDEEADVPLPAPRNFRYSAEESVDDDSYPGQSGPREGNQPILCHPSAVMTCNITDCHSCKEEDGTAGGESGRGSEKEGERGMAKDKAGGRERETDRAKRGALDGRRERARGRERDGASGEEEHMVQGYVIVET